MYACISSCGRHSSSMIESSRGRFGSSVCRIIDATLSKLFSVALGNLLAINDGTSSQNGSASGVPCVGLQATAWPSTPLLDASANCSNKTSCSDRLYVVPRGLLLLSALAMGSSFKVFSRLPLVLRVDVFFFFLPPPLDDDDEAAPNPPPVAARAVVDADRLDGANDSATSGNKMTALHREMETRMVMIVGYHNSVCFSSFGSRFTSMVWWLVEVGGWHRASFSILRHYEAARPASCFTCIYFFVVRQCRPGPVSSHVCRADAFAFFTITSHIHGRLVVGNGTAAPTNQ